MASYHVELDYFQFNIDMHNQFNMCKLSLKVRLFITSRLGVGYPQSLYLWCKYVIPDPMLSCVIRNDSKVQQIYPAKWAKHHN